MPLQISRDNILILFFIIVALASSMDLIADFSHGADMAHILKESLLVLLSLIAVGWLFYEARIQAEKIITLKQELEQANNISQQPNDYLLEGRRHLSEIMTHQFKDWQLTESEAEIGLFLLKGLSLKEIAALRNTTEKTVRQQASSVYKKARLPGRHAFSAWFIEDIL